MNALKLSIFDTAAPFLAEYTAAAAEPRVRTGVAPLKGEPVSLWRQSLAAHEPAARVRWTLRVSFAALGVMSAASVVCAAAELCRGMIDHHGLQAAVQSLLGH